MRLLSLLGLVVALASLAGTPVRSQEPTGAVPTTPDGLYAAFRTIFAQGKYDLAAEYLKAFLAANPSDQDLLALENKYGAGTFQYLQTVPRWSDDPAADKAAKDLVATLTAKVRTANDKVLHDPAQIEKFIKNLGETYEERVFAENELRRSGEAAVPYMVNAFRSGSSPEIQAGILDTIPKLYEPAIAGWLAAMDGFSPGQRYSVFSAILTRPDALNLPSFAETDYTPYLWNVAALPPDEAPALRRLALSLLGRLYPGSIERRDPVAELVRIGRTFYERKARFRTATNRDPAGVGLILWKWDGANNKLIRTDKVPVTKVEEYFGLRYARWALERRPSDEPAQRLILSLATERAVERGKYGELSRTAPEAYHLLADAPTPLLADLLGEALFKKQTALALGLTQALADRADKSVTIAAPSPAGAKARPSLLVRALDYPDIRVQIAAANGLLRSAAPLSPPVRARILEVLKGAAGADGGVAKDTKGQALLVDPNRLRNDAQAALLRGMGFSVEPFILGRDLLRRVGQGSDFDLVLVDQHVVEPQLNDFLSQLRTDLKAAGVPVVVVASPNAPRRPTLEGLLLRVAVLIAATETTPVEIPAPYVPDRRRPADDNDRLRFNNRIQRDKTLRQAVDSRIARLTRVLDNSNMVFSADQRAFLKLRIEQITWSVLKAQYPITPESAPGTVDYLELFGRQLAIQPQIAPYNTGGIEGLLERIERLQVDVDNDPAIRARYDALRAAVDVEALGLDLGATRDPVMEANVARKVHAYPGVTVIPEPYSRIGFEEDLKQAFADAGRAPRDPAEKKAAAKMAIEWLRQMAAGEVLGFDVRPAEAEMRAALRFDDLAPAAIDGVAHLKSAEAQQDLLSVALSTMRPASLRARAADAAIRHIQANGKLVPKTLIDALVPLADAETNLDVRARLMVLKGLLATSSKDFLGELYQYVPVEPAPPAPAPAAVPDPEPKN